MASKYKVGDMVQILGCVEKCGWLYYNDDNNGPLGNMDDFIGKIGQIIKVVERGFEHYSYIISGCDNWQWMDSWIAPANEDFNFNEEVGSYSEDDFDSMFQ